MAPEFWCQTTPTEFWCHGISGVKLHFADVAPLLEFGTKSLAPRLPVLLDHDNGVQQTQIVIHNGREVLLQAFNWESRKHDWWRNLERKVPDMAKSGITSAWLPPATHSFSPEGYLPQNLYSLNSSYGSESLLKALLNKMKQYNIRPMADIVINHRVGTTQGHGGMYNRYDGVPLSWDERAVTSCTGGRGNRSTGDNFNGVPNIDHTQDFVRKDIIGWLKWLRHKVGFQDFRFDFARGYSAKYVKEYIEGAKPIFSVGEYWDTCNYKGTYLDYNQGALGGLNNMSKRIVIGSVLSIGLMAQGNSLRHLTSQLKGFFK
ncbi:probable alpha-amylase 2 [Tanacetum coccineum]